MNRIPIILDVDTGVDDTLALMYALSDERFDIKGITTAYGNTTLDKVNRNTLQVLELLGGTDIPVASGADRALQMDGEYVRKFKSVHGESGLGDVDLPEPQTALIEENAVEFMVRILRESEEKITLVPVGPMTNIAVLLMAHPELKEKIDKVCIMGGAALGGNAAPTAEANIIRDPEAAFVLFQSGVPIYMFGLDVTMKAYVTEEELARMKAVGNPVSDKICQMLDFYAQHYRSRKHPGCAIHDAVPLFWLLHPQLVTTKPYYVVVDMDGEHTRGCTVTDLVGISRMPANAEVGTDIDRKAFVEALIDGLKKYS